MASPRLKKLVERVILLQANAEGVVNAVLLFKKKHKKKSACCPCSCLPKCRKCPTCPT